MATNGTVTQAGEYTTGSASAVSVRIQVLAFLYYTTTQWSQHKQLPPAYADRSASVHALSRNRKVNSLVKKASLHAPLRKSQKPHSLTADMTTLTGLRRSQHHIRKSPGASLGMFTVNPRDGHNVISQHVFYTP